MKRVAVIGATGTIGRAVIAELVASGVDDVVAVSRTVEASSVPEGVRAVQADLMAPATLDKALRDVDAVFLVWTAPGDAAPAAVDRIARSVKRLVFLSAPHKTPHPFFQQTNPMAVLMARVEALIEASTIEWTILRPGMFAGNALAWWAPQIRRGNVVRWPFGAAASAPIDERDIAAVAVRVHREGGHGGRDYVLTGPESLTQAEQVGLIGEALGRNIEFEEISPDEARSELSFPPAALNMLLKAWSASVGLPAFVTSDVAEITGRRPRTYREWSVDHAHAFR
ncbi:MAG TPA: NAD(P)H-binding protein [Thermoanaerobaculia bacterium]